MQRPFARKAFLTRGKGVILGAGYAVTIVLFLVWSYAGALLHWSHRLALAAALLPCVGLAISRSATLYRLWSRSGGARGYESVATDYGSPGETAIKEELRLQAALGGRSAADMARATGGEHSPRSSPNSSPARRGRASVDV